MLLKTETDSFLVFALTLRAPKTSHYD